ncbi:MAG: type IV conjugative transfer system protein TraL [Campylobacterales bacterium]|nr:type IV conjugative transfer system protein TraL [Campylobacterales bacterium]
MNNKAEEFSPRFYRHIDDPIMILFFEIDDMAISFIILWLLLVISFVVGAKAGGVIFLYIGISLLAGAYYNRFKKNKPNGYIFQFLYKKGVYHPLHSLGFKKYTNYAGDYKVAPRPFTKAMRGQ